MKPVPIVRDVCLVGGGHSHTLLLRRWAMQPLAGVRLTLISSSVQTPYSGMLPGLIAGHYDYDDIHIDLLRLCAWADVRFVEDTVIGIDLDARQAHFEQRPNISFDVLCLDTGSTPDLSVPGSKLHVTPVKPVSDFHVRWTSICKRLSDTRKNSVSIGVVGSGAGGFELVTAMRYRLRSTAARFYWFLRGEASMSGRSAKVGRLAIAAAEAAGIEIVRHFDVTAVEPNKLIAADGREFILDEIIWCTAAQGPNWPAAAGLDTDERGFVATNAFLQSTSHSFVFASGDIGTQIDTPSRKAGVFAVRQAPILYENIRGYLLHSKLQTFKPQRDFLSLMATGPRHAIASRGPFVLNADWVWHWKNRIDQTFMDKFRQLPVRRMNASLARLPNALADQEPDDSVHRMRCRGCGAKIGHDVLQRVLDDLLCNDSTNRIATAWSPAGDTAVIELPASTLVQSVDQINAIVDDPYLMGRIAALHSLSDVITLNSIVHSAQVLLTLPEATEVVLERDLRLMMTGLLSALEEESCSLVGGHSAQGPDMSVGLTINATLRPSPSPASLPSPLPASDHDHSAENFIRVAPGDALILTKALGIGTLFAGLMQSLAAGADISQAIDSMLMSNRRAADILRHHGSVAMTDITGFGLLGHLLRLVDGLSLRHPLQDTQRIKPNVALSLEHIPILSGALALSHQGCRSSLWQQNSSAFSHVTMDATCSPAETALLVDPQTSGGLLAVVPDVMHRKCVEALHDAGFRQSSLIGFIAPVEEVCSTKKIHVAHTLEFS